jgi:hypothetical protein
MLRNQNMYAVSCMNILLLLLLLLRKRKANNEWRNTRTFDCMYEIRKVLMNWNFSLNDRKVVMSVLLSDNIIMGLIFYGNRLQSL